MWDCVAGVMCEDSALIERDVVRTDRIASTMKDRAKYKKLHPGVPKRAPLLSRLLRAVTIVDDMGYCQGMNYVADIILEATDDNLKDAFCILLFVLRNRHLGCLYETKLPILSLYMDVFDHQLKHRCPALATKLTNEGFIVPYFAIEWFTTCYTLYMPLPLTKAIFELWLAGTENIFVRMGLAVMELLHDKLMSLSLEQLLKDFRTLVLGVKPIEAVQLAMSIKLANWEITQMQTARSSIGMAPSGYAITDKGRVASRDSTGNSTRSSECDVTHQPVEVAVTTCAEGEDILLWLRNIYLSDAVSVRKKRCEDWHKKFQRHQKYKLHSGLLAPDDSSVCVSVDADCTHQVTSSQSPMSPGGVGVSVDLEEDDDLASMVNENLISRMMEFNLIDNPMAHLEAADDDQMRASSFDCYINPNKAAAPIPPANAPSETNSSIFPIFSREARLERQAKIRGILSRAIALRPPTPTLEHGAASRTVPYVFPNMCDRVLFWDISTFGDELLSRDGHSRRKGGVSVGKVDVDVDGTEEDNSGGVDADGGADFSCLDGDSSMHAQFFRCDCGGCAAVDTFKVTMRQCGRLVNWTELNRSWMECVCSLTTTYTFEENSPSGPGPTATPTAASSSGAANGRGVTTLGSVKKKWKEYLIANHLLYYAIISGCHLRVVSFLLAVAGADPNYQDLNLVTPLHLAVLHERVPVIRLLLLAGADAKVVGALSAHSQKSHMMLSPKHIALIMEAELARSTTEAQDNCWAVAGGREDVVYPSVLVLGGFSCMLCDQLLLPDAYSPSLARVVGSDQDGFDGQERAQSRCPICTHTLCAACGGRQHWCLPFKKLFKDPDGEVVDVKKEAWYASYFSRLPPEPTAVPHDLTSHVFQTPAKSAKAENSVSDPELPIARLPAPEGLNVATATPRPRGVSAGAPPSQTREKRRPSVPTKADMSGPIHPLMVPDTASEDELEQDEEEEGDAGTETVIGLETSVEGVHRRTSDKWADSEYDIPDPPVALSMQAAVGIDPPSAAKPVTTKKRVSFWKMVLGKESADPDPATKPLPGASVAPVASVVDIEVPLKELVFTVKSPKTSTIEVSNGAGRVRLGSTSCGADGLSRPTAAWMDDLKITVPSATPSSKSGGAAPYMSEQLSPDLLHQMEPCSPASSVRDLAAGASALSVSQRYLLSLVLGAEGPVGMQLITKCSHMSDHTQNVVTLFSRNVFGIETSGVSYPAHLGFSSEVTHYYCNAFLFFQLRLLLRQAGTYMRNTLFAQSSAVQQLVHSAINQLVEIVYFTASTITASSFYSLHQWGLENSGWLNPLVRISNEAASVCRGDADAGGRSQPVLLSDALFCNKLSRILVQKSFLNHYYFTMLQLYIHKGVVSCGIDRASMPSADADGHGQNVAAEASMRAQRGSSQFWGYLTSKYSLYNDFHNRPAHAWYCNECSRALPAANATHGTENPADVRQGQHHCTRCRRGFCDNHRLHTVSLVNLLLREDKTSIAPADDSEPDTGSRMAVLDLFYDVVAITISKITSSLINDGQKQRSSHRSPTVTDDFCSGGDNRSLSCDAEATIEVCQFMTTTVLCCNDEHVVQLASRSGTGAENTPTERRKNQNMLTLGYVICKFLLQEGGLVDDNSSICLCADCDKECGEYNGEIIKHLKKDFSSCSFPFWSSYLAMAAKGLSTNTSNPQSNSNLVFVSDPL